MQAARSGRGRSSGLWEEVALSMPAGAGANERPSVRASAQQSFRERPFSQQSAGRLQVLTVGNNGRRLLLSKQKDRASHLPTEGAVHLRSFHSSAVGISVTQHSVRETESLAGESSENCPIQEPRIPAVRSLNSELPLARLRRSTSLYSLLYARIASLLHSIAPWLWYSKHV